jgi:endonuclease G
MIEKFNYINLDKCTIPDTDSIQMSASDTMVNELIILDNNLVPVQFLRTGVEVAESVCHLRYRKGGATYVASGFMISPSLLMTNNHVFESIHDAQKANAYFKYEDGVSGEVIEPLERKVNPDKFFYSNKDLDVAIVAIDQMPGEEFGYLPLLKSPDKVGLYKRVNIIQHPKGRRKELSLQENKVSQFFKNKIHYLADTEKGSSGSPVFNNEWQIVALHHAGSFSHNEGVRISAICNHIEQNILKGSSDWGTEALTNELLNHIN